MTRRHLTTTATILSLSLAASAGLAESQIDGFRSKMEKWVETRSVISAETSDWTVDKQTMQATRDLLREQKQRLEEEIGALNASTTAADEERRDLQLQRGEYQRASSALRFDIEAFEAEVKSITPSLPAPLVEKLEPLLVQIPEDPESTRQPLGQRLMNVLGILAQAEKFNDAATFVGETRSLGAEEKVRVRTLYWGLGHAVYVDARGRAAGIGRPGAQGWEFTNEPELADAAALLLDIYEGNVDVIEFVELPVEVHQ